MGNGEGYQLHIWCVFVVYLFPHLNNRGSEGPPLLISLDFFFFNQDGEKGRERSVSLFILNICYTVLRISARKFFVSGFEFKS